MRLDREGRRTVAQFLNSIAVALLSTLVLAPVAAGSFNLGGAVAGALAAALLHLAAIAISAQ